MAISRVKAFPSSARRVARTLRPLQLLGVIMLMLGLTGCESFLFYPDQVRYSDPEDYGPQVKTIRLKTKDGGLIHGWWLPSLRGHADAVLVQFHGNAQNLTAHVQAMAWITQHNYDLVVFDYRGYGQSTGTPSVARATEDGRLMLEYIGSQRPDLPVVPVGQSIGGAIALNVLAGDHQGKKGQEKVSALVLEGTFTSFYDIADEVVSNHWSTYWMKPLVLPYKRLPNSRNNLSKLKHLPLLVVHSPQDEVIPYHHGESLFAEGGEDRHLHTSRGPHMASFQFEESREALITFLQRLKQHQSSGH